MRVLNLNESPPVSITDVGIQSKYSILPSFIIKEKPNFDGKFDFVSIFPTGYVFNLHFYTGIDWKHLLLSPSEFTESADKSIILRFNYSETRELFDIKKVLAG